MRKAKGATVSEILVANLRQAIEAVTVCQHPRLERWFLKHYDYLSYGLTAPEFRKMMKAFRLRFLAFSLQQRLNLTVKLLGEHIGELGHAGIYVVALSIEELQPRLFPILDRLADHFRSWSHVNYFCYEVAQLLLAKYHKKVLTFLKDWSRSPNRFKRRASIVAFTGQVAESGRFTDQFLRLCENLIWDHADIVRKGVGWALKDNLRSAPERILPYIKDLRRKGILSTITLYAIRDLKGTERQAILSVKKASEK